MLWSVLISGIPERYHTVQPLLFSLLETQSAARIPDIELCYLLDNKRRTVGAKRNALLDMARGEYVSFIDDDDLVATDYVQRIHRAIGLARKSEAPADVICFPQRATLHPHMITHECTYSLAYWRDRKPEDRRQLAPAPGKDGQPLPNVLLCGRRLATRDSPRSSLARTWTGWTRCARRRRQRCGWSASHCISINSTRKRVRRDEPGQPVLIRQDAVAHGA